MDRETAGRRLASARELAGLNQKELGALMEARKANKHDVALIERGHKELSDANKDTLTELLPVPRAWFEIEDLPSWLSAAAQQPAEDLRAQLCGSSRHSGRWP